jgi:hypothetical protein
MSDVTPEDLLRGKSHGRYVQRMERFRKLFAADKELATSLYRELHKEDIVTTASSIRHATALAHSVPDIVVESIEYSIFEMVATQIDGAWDISDTTTLNPVLVPGLGKFKISTRRAFKANEIIQKKRGK